jgi:diaminohydroxyphosphoribosylaminopyrimidine deaminase/5-amino-6-(5-phosphoribosylamino)uracil reductase
MVEGGSHVASSFVAADLVDEAWLLRGPGAIGADGIPALAGLPLDALTASPRLEVVARDTWGADALTVYTRKGV